MARQKCVQTPRCGSTSHCRERVARSPSSCQEESPSSPPPLFRFVGSSPSALSLAALRPNETSLPPHGPTDGTHPHRAGRIVCLQVKRTFGKRVFSCPKEFARPNFKAMKNLLKISLAH